MTAALWAVPAFVIIFAVTWGVGRMMAVCRMERPLVEQRRDAWK